VATKPHREKGSPQEERSGRRSRVTAIDGRCKDTN